MHKRTKRVGVCVLMCAVLSYVQNTETCGGECVCEDVCEPMTGFVHAIIVCGFFGVCVCFFVLYFRNRMRLMLLLGVVDLRVRPHTTETRQRMNVLCVKKN